MKLNRCKLSDTVQKTLSITAIADTGATELCIGPNTMLALNFTKQMLLQAKLVMRAADDRKLCVMGAIPVVVSHTDQKQSYEGFLYIVDELNNIFLSKTCLTALGSISEHFLHPLSTEQTLNSISQNNDSNLAPS